MKSGDLNGLIRYLGSLQKTLGELDSFPKNLSLRIAGPLSTEFQKQFSRGSDPYGRTWKPLKTGKPSHLTETRRFRSGSRIAAMPGNRAGVRVILGRLGKRGRNPIYHMTGTRYMTARKYLPTRGMPAAWREIIKREASRLMRERRAS